MIDIRKSKYAGLQKIKAYGLPHPNWKCVFDIKELPLKPWSPAPFGWTIRYAPKGNYKFNLPSVHEIPYQQLKRRLKHQLMEHPELRPCVIYPSWVFLLGGTLMKNTEQITIEVMRGSITPLLEGRSNPDIIIKFTGPYYTKLVEFYGKCNPEELQIINTTRGYALKITGPEDCLLEWSYTTTNDLYFHDWLDI